jgi:uncharacterized protein DUF4388/tetratricopeptide repeat protein
MAIEGPLRELGIHDVFQLLDLSRKTGKLRVTSNLRDNEGTVYFDVGHVVGATIRSNPYRLGTLLVRAGKITEADLTRVRTLQRESGDKRRLGSILVAQGTITQRELERQVRLQVEAVVFELMSWEEGFFSFAESDVSDVSGDAVVRISTESLLMEGARRIDEWTRIAHKVPHLGVIPVLASSDDGHPSQLDLLPNEWEMLASIDGVADLRDIAATLGRSDFDVAKVAYGLLSTGVIEVREPDRAAAADISLGGDDPSPHLERSKAALERGHGGAAFTAAAAAVTAAPDRVDARLALARALVQLERYDEAAEELRRAARLDACNAEVHIALGIAEARRGYIEGAVASWQRALLERSTDDEGARIREMIECATRLQALMEGLVHV